MTSQSVYLFIQKFKGNQGLIKYLKSSFDDIKLLNQPNRGKASKNIQRKLDFVSKKRGISADAEDKKWRIKQFGRNVYPQPRSFEIGTLLNEVHAGLIMRVLLVCAICHLILEIALN